MKKYCLPKTDRGTKTLHNGWK